MPWHKTRVISEHGGKSRARLAYWLNVSILAAILLIVLVWMGAVNLFVGEMISPRPFHHGVRAAFEDPAPSESFSWSPELSAGITLACCIWLVVAFSLKPRS